MMGDSGNPKRIGSVDALAEYERDLRHLARRFRGLEEDIRAFVDKPLTYFLRGEPVAGRFERVAGLGFDSPEVYVAKRIACRALKGRGSNTGLRLVYAWFPKTDCVELVELYFKADRDKEDKDRIRRLYRDRWRTTA